jgi:acyl carrier protein
MAMITLIALIEDKYKKKIKVSNIKSIKTIQDLDDLISKTIK